MNFVILALQRTGSSHLMGALRLHPEIFCHGELFNTARFQASTTSPQWRIENETELLALRAADPRKFLERMSTLSFSKTFVGFKMMSAHDPAIFEAVLTDPRIGKIVTTRENGLARYASLAAARRSGKFGNTGSKGPIHFEARAFGDHLAEDAAFHARVRGALAASGQSVHLFRFEHINSRSAIQAACRFVGARSPVIEMRPPPDNRATGDVLSRFSNPSAVRDYLKERGLLAWSIENLAPPEEAIGEKA